MPPGEKLLVTVMTTHQAQIAIHTFMTPDKIYQQYRPTKEDYVNGVHSDWAQFEGVNPADQPVIIEIDRNTIVGVVIAPFFKQAVAPAEHGGSRRMIQ